MVTTGIKQLRTDRPPGSGHSAACVQSPDDDQEGVTGELRRQRVTAPEASESPTLRALALLRRGEHVSISMHPRGWNSGTLGLAGADDQSMPGTPAPYVASNSSRWSQPRCSETRILPACKSRLVQGRIARGAIQTAVGLHEPCCAERGVPA
jgi:hypothetical protein